jgi:N-acetylglucosaminyldiphosphoundecaprenol N-acetyl-beta-D-mannosaminyltransferase
MKLLKRMLSNRRSMPSDSRNRANVLGIGVDAVDMQAAVRAIASAVAAGDKGYVCATGVHGVMEARRNADMRRALAEAMLVVPDGMPTVWMGRLQGLRQMRRVFGPDLMLEIFRSSALEGCKHFLYGGAEGVASELRDALEHRFPKCHIVGIHTPPFRPLHQQEEAELRTMLSRMRPDILWVGLSTPKQELFMARYLPRLETKLMIGVGAAFDYHTGRLKDSPQWLKPLGLQWLHRLLQEPRRLWKRYLVNNPAFVSQALLQLTGIRHFDLPR